VRRSTTGQANVSPPGIDPELADRMSEVNRLRSEFEERVRVARERGGHSDEDARRLIRQRMENSGRDLAGSGEFEAGQTYATSRGESGEITTAANQRSAGRPITQVASTRLEAHVAELNRQLNINYVVNRQSLNHAEVRQLLADPSRTDFYPDRTMCDSCQKMFVLESRARGTDLHVIDPDRSARTFTPDGRIIEFRADTVYVRRTVTVTNSNGRTEVQIRARPRTPDVVVHTRPATQADQPRPIRRGNTDVDSPATRQARQSGRVSVPETTGSAAGTSRGSGSVRTGAGHGLRARGFMRGMSGGVAMGAVGLLFDIAELIWQLTVVPVINRYITQLQDWQRENLRRQIEQRLELYQPIVESRLEQMSPTINDLWEQELPAFSRTHFKAIFEDQRERSIFEEQPPVPSDPFDLNFYAIEDFELSLVDAPVEDSVTQLEPSTEYTLTSFDPQQRRAWYLFSGTGGPLIEQSITSGFELPPPDVEPVRDEEVMSEERIDEAREQYRALGMPFPLE
jgi:hypothetical protein